MDRGFGRRKEFCFRSVDAYCRELSKVLNASWRSKTEIQKRVSLVPPMAVWLREQGKEGPFSRATAPLCFPRLEFRPLQSTR